MAVHDATASCLEIRNGTLRSGQRFRFVTTTLPRSVGVGEVTSEVAGSCSKGVQAEPNLHGYSFSVVEGSLRNGSVAFALVGNGAVVPTVGENGVSADLDADGQPEWLRSCTSSEGVHLTIWSAPQPGGRRLWHAYYFLGYDVEPTCTEEETRP